MFFLSCSHLAENYDTHLSWHLGKICVKSIVNRYTLRGNFFQCHIFAMKSVQNLKSFWRSSQNYFVLALFSSL
jgi:hypothetical protein